MEQSTLQQYIKKLFNEMNHQVMLTETLRHVAVLWYVIEKNCFFNPFSVSFQVF